MLVLRIFCLLQCSKRRAIDSWSTDRAELAAPFEARVFAKVGLGQLLLRVAIVLMSGVAGLFAAVVVVRWIPGAPLAGGGYEGTPVHVAGFFGTWVLVTLVGGCSGIACFHGASRAGLERVGLLSER